ncbi:MAG: hypothetical protein LT070_02130 [Solirubrobacteraceae bacterium]|nr:hypothetical protein [Solirubrobacteraceae bacterium]
MSTPQAPSAPDPLAGGPPRPDGPSRPGGDPRRPPSRLARRLPLLALALVALLTGLWAGLLRLGFDIPELRPALASLHGPLLVLGFLGTQIGLERAVALRRRWPYLVPAAAAAGALWLVVGLPADVGKALLAVGGLGLVAVFVVVHRIQASWHNVVMGLGALAWLVGSVAWLAGAALADVVPWLAAFLVLTIVGERLELSRMRRPPASALRLLLAAVAIFLAGVVLTGAWPGFGVRLAGAGLIAQSAWLWRYDIARLTIRTAGAARYMAAALISGYAWLGVAGVVWLVDGKLVGYGFGYDAMLHAIFVGFVFSMIFAHAPVIVPAVLSVALPYRPAFYAPLALLHAGLVIRLLGGAFESSGTWRLGGALNELAIVGYLALAAATAVRARRRPAPAG